MKHQQWPLVATGFALCGFLSCLDAVDEKSCQEACQTARRCGLLPSALGGATNRSQFDNEVDCIVRCQASTEDAIQVEGLLRILRDQTYASTPNNRQDSLCRPDGVDLCEELIEDLETNADTSELSVTTDLTVRMTSALSHATNFSAASWCCFDYQYDIYEVPDDVNGDGVPEVEAIHDMLQPTYECVNGMLALLGTLDNQTMGVMPDESVSPTVRGIVHERDLVLLEE